MLGLGKGYVPFRKLYVPCVKYIGEQSLYFVKMNFIVPMALWKFRLSVQETLYFRLGLKTACSEPFQRFFDWVADTPNPRSTKAVVMNRSASCNSATSASLVPACGESHVSLAVNAELVSNGDLVRNCSGIFGTARFFELFCFMFKPLLFKATTR